MSRTNPSRKKPCAAKKTLLIYGEGLDEKKFVEHLRGIYAKDSGVKVSIRRGKGGSPKDIIIQAAKEFGEFDKRVVVVDTDRGAQEVSDAREEAQGKNIELIENSPCLEALLLSILDNGKSFSSKTSKWCKKEFQSKYGSSNWGNIFTKKLLDERRKNIEKLNKLIGLISNEQ